MDKKEVLKILFYCSQKYKENLAGKTTIFLTKNSNNRIEPFEVFFNASNFFHLTGIELTKGYLDQLDDSVKGVALHFYHDCLDKRLKESDFFEADDFCVLKLKVLPSAVRRDISAKMYGVYSNNLEQKLLSTSKLVGGKMFCLGFIRAKDSNKYVPNTLLNKNIKELTNGYNRVIAAFNKKLEDDYYTNCVYMAKKVDLKKEKLPAELLYLIDLI